MSFAGMRHGGMLAVSLDIVMGRSMARLLNIAHAPTVSMKVDFMRAGSAGRLNKLCKHGLLLFKDG